MRCERSVLINLLYACKLFHFKYTMSAIYNIITQDDGDIAPASDDDIDDDIEDDETVIRPFLTAATPPTRLVQLTLFREVVPAPKFKTSGGVLNSKTVAVTGHYRKNGAYVKGYVRRITSIPNKPKRVPRRRSSLRHARYADIECVATRKLVARLHFEELMAMHERNYPK